MLNLFIARKSALKNIRHFQIRYKKYYDQKTDEYQYKIGDWVLICFQVRRVDNKGNCHASSMILIGSPLAMILMLLL